jgi:hypothetical protein
MLPSTRPDPVLLLIHHQTLPDGADRKWEGEAKLQRLDVVLHKAQQPTGPVDGKRFVTVEHRHRLQESEQPHAVIAMQVSDQDLHVPVEPYPRLGKAPLHPLSRVDKDDLAIPDHGDRRKPSLRGGHSRRCPKEDQLEIYQIKAYPSACLDKIIMFIRA